MGSWAKDLQFWIVGFGSVALDLWLGVFGLVALAWDLGFEELAQGIVRQVLGEPCWAAHSHGS